MLQASVHNWGKLLLAAGRALKPAKRSHCQISFQSWKLDGTWTYCSNKTKENLTLQVPFADSSLKEMEHLSINKAVKTLGSMTCPSECNSATIEYMQLHWEDRVKSNSLSRPNFGLCLTASYSLELALEFATQQQAGKNSLNVTKRYITR
jgi:hypothetical protein